VDLLDGRPQAQRVGCAGGKGSKAYTSEDRNAHTDPEYLGKIIRAHDEGFFSSTMYFFFSIGKRFNNKPS
jgi:hypothetical protein